MTEPITMQVVKEYLRKCKVMKELASLEGFCLEVECTMKELKSSKFIEFLDMGIIHQIRENALNGNYNKQVALSLLETKSLIKSPHILGH